MERLQSVGVDLEPQHREGGQRGPEGRDKGEMAQIGRFDSAVVAVRVRFEHEVGHRDHKATDEERFVGETGTKCEPTSRGP